MDLIQSNLQVGLTVTCIGMLAVLFFLVIMIFTVSIMEKVVIYLNKKFPIAIDDKKEKKSNNNQEEEIAVVIAAVLNKMKEG